MRKPFEFNKRLIVITASIIIAALSALIFCLMNPLKANSQNQTAEGISFDNNAVAYNLDAPAEQAIGGISVPGYSTVYFPQGEQIVPITLWNPEKNTCLFQFELYIGEESTPIAATELIRPGMAVKTVTLAYGLNVGEYTLKIKVNTFNAETGTPLNNALVSAKLCVVE